jgi:ADP-dependent NAD(P)H-hydrate dehydratase / NAD(P)H-hydrate epimerase
VLSGSGHCVGSQVGSDNQSVVATQLAQYLFGMIELLTTAEMAEADRLAIAGGTTGIVLMENAGRAVADRVSANHRVDAHVVVVAGPGNNGGDGFVAAKLLAERGYAVRLLLAGARDRLKGDAALAAERFTGSVEVAAPEHLSVGGKAADAIVDALFGAGLDRPVEGLAHDLIAAMNAARARIYAVDLPSGINGTSGAVMGLAVEATETITFFRRKPGHMLLPGRLHCGAITLADIGIPAATLASIKPQTFLNEAALWRERFPVPRPDGHKYSRGHAVVLSGGISSTGAARMAARGALRAGAGLVTIASPREALAVNAAASLAVMVRPVDGAGELAAFLSDARRNAVVLGPGGGVGQLMREMVATALSGKRAVVLDADALTSFAEEPQALIAAIRARVPSATVLTPHEGEFKAFFAAVDDMPKSGSKLERARAAAACTGAVVLLKGSDTVVAAPDGRAAITANAPPWLATAGAGDVLAGFVAGLLAQRMPVFEAAAAAVWLHGEVGAVVGPGLIAEDLPEALPQVYRQLLIERVR